MEKKPEAVATAMEFQEKEAMWARILAKMEELSSALDRVLGSPSAPSTRINAAASSPLAATTEGTNIESDATPMPPAPTRCSALCLNHVVIEPMVPFTLMASATAATTMPLDMATVVPTASLQEEVGQLGALQVFDRTPERIRSGAKHPRFVKWVSRVPINRRPVRWPPRRKYRHSSPPPPPCPPEQQCVGQETAPKPLPWPSFQFVTLLRCNYKLTAPEKKAWCQNAFSPGEKQLHRVHLFKLFCPAVVLQHGSYMMLVSLLKQWKSSPGIWYLDGILFGAKEWVLRICSRNSLLDTCGITCMLRSRFRLSSDQGQGELFACIAGKSVEVPCSIFSLNILLESVQCSAINVLELFFRNSWALARPPEQVLYHAPCHQCFVFEDVFPQNQSSLNPDRIGKTAECLVFEFFISRQINGFSLGSILAKSGHLLHCSWTDHLSVHWDPGVLQLVLCGTFKWMVTLVHSLCPQELTSACIVLDIMPPWRRGGFSPGNPFCSCLIGCYLCVVWDSRVFFTRGNFMLWDPGSQNFICIPCFTLAYLDAFHQVQQLPDLELCLLLLVPKCNNNQIGVFTAMDYWGRNTFYTWNRQTETVPLILERIYMLDCTCRPSAVFKCVGEEGSNSGRIHQFKHLQLVVILLAKHICHLVHTFVVVAVSDDSTSWFQLGVYVTCLFRVCMSGCTGHEEGYNVVKLTELKPLPIPRESESRGSVFLRYADFSQYKSTDCRVRQVFDNTLLSKRNAISSTQYASPTHWDPRIYNFVRGTYFFGWDQRSLLPETLMSLYVIQWDPGILTHTVQLQVQMRIVPAATEHFYQLKPVVHGAQALCASQESRPATWLQYTQLCTFQAQDSWFPLQRFYMLPLMGFELEIYLVLIVVCLASYDGMEIFTKPTVLLMRQLASSISRCTSLGTSWYSRRGDCQCTGEYTDRGISDNGAIIYRLSVACVLLFELSVLDRVWAGVGLSPCKWISRVPCVAGELSR